MPDFSSLHLQEWGIWLGDVWGEAGEERGKEVERGRVLERKQQLRISFDALTEGVK